MAVPPRPIQEFIKKWDVYFDANKRQQLLQAIVDEVSDVYLTMSIELLKSAWELEQSLKSRKLQRRSGPSSDIDNSAVSDTEKMRLQLLLDLEEVQRELAAMGLDVKQCIGLQSAIAKLCERVN